AYDLAKAGVAFLAGDDVFWDYSADQAIAWPSADRDFYVGTAASDAVGVASKVLVNLNARPAYQIDLLRDPFVPAPIGTVAAGGFGYPRMFGGLLQLLLSSTNEAQKVDALSKEGFAPGTP